MLASAETCHYAYDWGFNYESWKFDPIKYNDNYGIGRHFKYPFSLAVRYYIMNVVSEAGSHGSLHRACILRLIYFP